MAEMPMAAKLKQQFLGQEVVFVYIANETYVDGWKQTIIKHALAGPNSVQLLDPDGLRAVHVYHVDGYPTYVLLDRNGRVLDANAPRPSDGTQVVKAIKRALAAR